MSKIAVVKPDHLGDLILSAPAIRAAEQHFGQITLFVSDSSRPLARFLFPNMELRSINFPHLARTKETSDNLKAAAAALNTYDLVLWLRDDPFIGPFTKTLIITQDFASGGYLTHETAIQKQMMLRHVANYSRTNLFSASSVRWPDKVCRVGLCIGSGFSTNRWPNVFWLQLAESLASADLQLVLIAGPGELKDAALLSRCFSRFARVVLGSMDFAAFLQQIYDLDLVIATDGGTAHICSLVKPVLSIFASSPWRRYAPFGRENVVVTRDLSCSPCCNFSMEEVNGCMTRECSLGLQPEFVWRALFGQSSREDGVIVQRGTSHTFEM